MSSDLARNIPRFHLYAEDGAAVEMDFLHVETIRARSALHDWVIRPHAHPEHVQVFAVTQGAVALHVEDVRWEATAPALYVIPAGGVHHMRFSPQSDGFVVTAALSYLRAVAGADAALAAVADRPLCIGPAPGDATFAEAADAFAALAREFVWPAPARRAAVAAHLVRILVVLLRAGGEARQDAAGGPSRDADLVRRFRSLVEERFREGLPVPAYARSLAVTQSRLNAACRAVAGRSASRVLHDRLLVEAKRNLLYTSLTVAEIAHALGFEDPAYFNRFFGRRVGVPPGRFRDEGRSPGRAAARG